MKYNKKLKLTAYRLSTDPDLNQNGRITQQMIADIFHVSQGTISNWIDDVKNELEKAYLRNQASTLQRELNELKESLQSENNGIIPLPEPDED